MILDDIDKTYKKINDAGHILKIILERAGVISHPLNLEFHLRVIRNSLLIVNHFLMNLVPELPELLSQLLSFILGLLESRLKLNAR